MVIENGALVAGRYRLIEQVGSGAMGVVWKAQDERLGRTVAIKRLVVRYALSDGLAEETRRRAMREARIAARLQHRNAIALFDVAEDDGDPILVMEFLPSKSLSLVLAERGTIPPAEAAEIGAQVAEALAAAHAVGIAHRDVKPGNILLAETGVVKITDFGISRALDDGTATTQTGMLAGTPAYLAPEIARGDDSSSRASDVFSLGSTLYHAIEGQPPFGTNTNPLALLHAVASGNVPPPRNAGSLTPTLMSLLRVDPNERPSMAEAASALATAPTLEVPRIAGPVRTPAKPVLPVLPMPPKPLSAQTTTMMPRPGSSQPQQAAGMSRRTAVIVAAVAVVVLIGTLLTVLALNNDDGDGSGNRQAGPASDGGTSQQETNTEGSPETKDTDSSKSGTTESTPSNAGSVAPDPGAEVDYSLAGQLVIQYYGDVQNTGGRFGMLSVNAQNEFGGQAGFQEYWGQFTDLSSENARGVTPNPDGTVNVPVDVTYTSAAGPKTEHQTVRVAQIGGQLKIDSVAK